jgi:hypothetical protein
MPPLSTVDAQLLASFYELGRALKVSVDTLPATALPARGHASDGTLITPSQD